MVKTLIRSDVKELLERALARMGVVPSYSGYSYLVDAIVMVYQNPEGYKGGIVSCLYPAIAHKYNSTPARVERCIRVAINKVDKQKLAEFIGFSIDHIKLTNANFIFLVATYLNWLFGEKEEEHGRAIQEA